MQDNYQEHKFHQSYDPNCSECYGENRMMHGLPKDEFSFENVIKVIGSINKAIYGINPYEKHE